MTKKKDPKDYLKVGRPTVFDEATLQKLEHGFKIGLTDVQCCAYADINVSTFYEYQKRNPEFLYKKEKWKQNPVAKAKYTIFNNLDDVKVAQWYLEKKCSDEFSGNQINNIVNVSNQNMQINQKDIDDAVKIINELK
jgi:hypothetical protein